MPGAAGAEDHHPVVLEVEAGDVDAGEDGREHHRRRALDVVVERADPVAVAWPGCGARWRRPKSSQCSIALGNRRVAVVTKRSMNSS